MNDFPQPSRYAGPGHPPVTPDTPPVYMRMPLPGSFAWREGRLLVIPPHADITGRCVKCNAPPAGPPLTANLSWHNPWFILLILMGVLIYVIVALIMTKRGTIYYSLCARHRSRRSNLVLAGWMGLLALVVFVVVAVALENPLYLVPGALLFLLGVILAIMSRTFRVKEITEEFMRIGGVSPEFLAQLPERSTAAQYQPFAPGVHGQGMHGQAM